MASYRWLGARMNTNVRLTAIEQFSRELERCGEFQPGRSVSTGSHENSER